MSSPIIVPKSRLTRRHFIKGAAGTCLATAAVPVLGAGVLGSAGCGGNPAPDVVLPAPQAGLVSIAIDGPHDVRTSAISKLATVGGAVLAQVTGHADPIMLVRADAATITATDATCTHQNCTVGFNAINYTLDCPCHGSSFELEGTIVNGPAQRPLATYVTQFDGSTLTISI